MSDTSTDEREQIFEFIKPYARQVNETPALSSLLYDLDLLPEQIVRPINAARLVAVCLLFRQLSTAQIESFIASTNEKPPEPPK
jgi:hypothetical protein